MSFSIPALGPYYGALLKDLEDLSAAGPLWQEKSETLRRRASEEFTDANDLLDTLHHIQRLSKIHIAGLGKNAKFHEAVQDAGLSSWKNFTSPPVPVDKQHTLAETLYNLKSVKGEPSVLLHLTDGSAGIGLWLAESCLKDGVPFVPQFSDPVFSTLLLDHADEKGVKALAHSFLHMTTPVNKSISAGMGLPDKEPPRPDPKKSKLYGECVRPYGERIRSGDIHFTITVIPTRKDAEIDGMPYEDYMDMFFEACDQPWDAIGKAHELLIEEFNAAEVARFTNSDGTDITINIKGFTFCNSLIAKNVPGSEIFSAPHRDSVNGVLVSKGKFSYGSGVVENLTMRFENGYLESWEAENGTDVFEKALSVDENTRYIGEIGIGTNPFLKRHVANTLLVEKIGGSFHLALGAAYTLTEYEGVPVNVDNGNQSGLHWDITTMLHGKEGRIYLDDRLIMDNGLWLDEKKYDVLNRGWDALKEG